MTNLKFPKIKFQNTLTKKQQNIIALIGTFVVVGLIVSVSIALTYTPPAERDSDNVVSLNDALSGLNSIDTINPQSLIFEEVSLQNVPLYPIAWVERHFSPIERGNDLISGPNADPDNDGLTNKLEYFQGSDPRNPDTLCNGVVDNNNCFGRTDGQNVLLGISPLTGLSIESIGTFVLFKTDIPILDRIQNSFEQQTREGVDFPTLYQLSRTIDLSNEYNEIQISSQKDNRQSILSYQEVQADILSGYLNDNQLTNFIEIYQITEPEELNEISVKLTEKVASMKQISVPESYVSVHRSFTMVFETLIDLVEHREQGLRDQTIFTEEFKEQSKAFAVRTTWAYRKMNESLENATRIGIQFAENE